MSKSIRPLFHPLSPEREENVDKGLQILTRRMYWAFRPNICSQAGPGPYNWRLQAGLVPGPYNQKLLLCFHLKRKASAPPNSEDKLALSFTLIKLKSTNGLNTLHQGFQSKGQIK
jgi:hypothetical protein